MLFVWKWMHGWIWIIAMLYGLSWLWLHLGCICEFVGGLIKPLFKLDSFCHVTISHFFEFELSFLGKHVSKQLLPLGQETWHKNWFNTHVNWLRLWLLRHFGHFLLNSSWALHYFASFLPLWISMRWKRKIIVIFEPLLWVLDLIEAYHLLEEAHLNDNWL